MITTAYFGPRSFPEQNEAVGDFVSAIIWGEAGRVKDYCSMAVVEDGRLIAGTLYHNWHPSAGAMELTSASLSRKWLTRPVIKAMFTLPFDMMGCQIVALRVSHRNKTMLRIARDFGFYEVVIPRLRGRDEDEHVFTLTDDQWKASRFNTGDLRRAA
jgi:RimJ/RimL family protein N-acetyltransferase